MKKERVEKKQYTKPELKKLGKMTKTTQAIAKASWHPCSP